MSALGKKKTSKIAKEAVQGVVDYVIMRHVKQIVKKATAKLVEYLITRHGDGSGLSAAQAAGILNVTTQTLRKLDIPFCDVTGNGGTITYDLKDINEYKESKKIK